MDYNLSLVIPIYNEEDNVSDLAHEIDEAFSCQRFEWEVIWVNDCSDDNTLEALKKISNKNIKHSILNLEARAGQSAAILSGIHNARFPLIGTLDGDGQNSPHDLVTLRELVIKNDLLLAQGVRKKRMDHPIRLLSTRLANLFRNNVLGIKLNDVGCAVRVFRRETLFGLPAFRGIHRFIPVLISFHHPDRIVEHPVAHRPRLKGKSKYGINNRLWVGLFDICGILWMKKRGFGLPSYKKV